MRICAAVHPQDDTLICRRSIGHRGQHSECIGKRGGRWADDVVLDPSWTPDEDGFVVAPLDNREGDPAFNGAFDRW